MDLFIYFEIQDNNCQNMQVGVQQSWMVWRMDKTQDPILAVAWF